MADKKISALTSVTLPLAGTEVLPVVQSSTTKKVSISEIQTAPISTGNAFGVLYLDGSKVPTSATSLTFDGSVLAGYNVSMRLFDASSNNRLIAGADASGAYINSTFGSGGTTDLRFQQASGTAWTLTNGNFVPATAAKGVNFTANTPAAGMTSQLLNWYEEGTFTPTDASGAGLTFTSATGKYTRIGRQVSVQLAVEYPTTANGSNTAIGGLPFTSANDGRNSCGVVLGNANILSVANVGPNTSVINLFDGANLNNRTNSDYSAKTAIINLVYTV